MIGYTFRAVSIYKYGRQSTPRYSIICNRLFCQPFSRRTLPNEKLSQIYNKRLP